MRTCMKHAPQMHRHIERIMEQYKRSVNGKPAILALVVTLTCKEVDDILEDVVARATGHELDHQAKPRLWVHPDGSPHLACSYCGALLTLEAEDAYREIVLHCPSSKKQSPRS